MKKIFLVVFAILIITSGIYYFAKTAHSPSSKVNSLLDGRNSTFTIENNSFTLVNGYSEVPFYPGATDTKIITRYFGNEIKHDLNNDGRDDIVFLITQERGGSGQFFYVVAALNTPTKYISSNPFLLGDRISPQSIHIDEGTTTQGTTRENVIVVNFANRKPNEPMTTRPSVGKSVWLKLDPATLQFGEVAQDFEGESR